MWGTFLSEPLPIVALVGRYPANQLIGRIPIHNRISLIKIKCSLLIPSDINLSFESLSLSYGQVGYALLTRAPVAIKCIATLMLPLDLHVLSLSLAFILSQDQTLRCEISFFCLFCSMMPSSILLN